LTRQIVRRRGRCVVSDTADSTTSSAWERVNLSSTVGQFRASLRRMSPLGALIVSMCGISLITILALLPRMSNVSGNFWLATLWLTWLASLIWALTRPSFSVIFTALMLSMFIFIIVPATGAQLYGGTVLATHNYQAGVIPALKIAVLAQVAMLAGAIGARTLRPVRGFDRIAINLSAARLDKAAIIAVTLAVSGVIGMSVIGGANLRDFFVYTTSGGYGTFWSKMHANLGFLVAVQCVGGLAIVLLPLQLSVTCSRRRVLPIAVAMLASLVLLGAGQRGPFIAAGSAAGLVWLKISKKRRRQRRAVMLGALLLLLITGLIGVARGAAASREVTFGNVIGEPFGAGNNLFLPVAGLSTTVPAEIPYLHGDSYLQIFVLPIPRALWPTKPKDDITIVTTRFDPEKSGLYFPAFGEGYANFGFIGVALCGVLLGGVAELLHRRFASSQDLKGSVVAAVQAGVFLQLFSRGDFAPMFTTYIGFLVAAGYISRRRSAVLAAVAIPWRRQTRQGDGGQWTTATAQTRLGSISAQRDRGGCGRGLHGGRGAGGRRR
jgi:oligosaccharide repeat unit polymerase